MTPAEARKAHYARPSPRAIKQGRAFSETPICSRITNVLRALVRSGICDRTVRRALITRLNEAERGGPATHTLPLLNYLYDHADPPEQAIVRAVVDYAAQLDGVTVDDLSG